MQNSSRDFDRRAMTTCEVDDFDFVRDVPVCDKKMFFIATFNILIRVYSHVCAGRSDILEKTYVKQTLWKMQDFRRLWEAFVDLREDDIRLHVPEKEIREIYTNNTRTQIYANYAAFAFKPIDEYSWKLGESFIAANFLYLGEIIGELPVPNNRVRDARAKHEANTNREAVRMQIAEIQKMCKIVHAILTLPGKHVPVIDEDDELQKIIKRIRRMLGDFLTEHRTIVAPFFSEYSDELKQGRMQWVGKDSDVLAELSPKMFVSSVIKREMFDQEWARRNLSGCASDVRKNQVVILQELGGLFVNNNLEELQVLTKVFLVRLTGKT